MVIYVTLTILTENGKLSLFSCKLRVLFFFFQKADILLLVFVFAILSCLFLAALWSPVGKGLAYWLSCMRCLFVFLSLSQTVSCVVFDCIDS